MLNTEKVINHNIETSSEDDFDDIFKKIQSRIQKEGDKKYVTVEKQLDILKKLAEFDLGKFVILNKCLDAYWTDYVISHDPEKSNQHMTDMERFVLEKMPMILATQERFKLFQKECQMQVKNHAVLASIPCGKMVDLLSLDYTNVNSIKLVGIDLDENALNLAKQYKQSISFPYHFETMQRNAWNLNVSNEYDLITSNGVNIYESSETKLVDLYLQFYNALKPSGKLITSFLTYPPNPEIPSEWELGKINSNDVLLQKIIFFDIVQMKCSCFQTSESIINQLKKAGFEDMSIVYDTQRIFPTITAIKK